jgi:hypothetical protein
MRSIADSSIYGECTSRRETGSLERQAQQQQTAERVTRRPDWAVIQL